MKKSILRRLTNRILHLFARYSPGATTLRPFLHRLRGMKVGEGVFIGDEVYLDNEYPEAVEIQNGVQISVRATILAHTRGSGKIVIERDAFVGPNTVITTSGDRTLRIGEGAVLGAGVVVTSDVPAHLFVVSAAATPFAKAELPLTKAEKLEDFIRGLRPIGRRPATGTSSRNSPASVGVSSTRSLEVD